MRSSLLVPSPPRPASNMTRGAEVETYADLIACEDVLMFVNAAITSTGQREFHSGEYGQRLSLGFLHLYMLENYRDLYASCLALDINDHNAALIVRHLLTSGLRSPLEGRLIARRLAGMPPQRVYALFRELRAARVNNRRTRAIIRDWMAARPDPAFDAVKYRGAVKAAVRHAHVSVAGEGFATAQAAEDRSGEHDAPHVGDLASFLFAPLRRPRYANPLLDAWRRAHFEAAAIYQLPYTVAEGFAAKHGVPREVFLERIAPNLTRAERLRLQETSRVHAVTTIDRDLSRMPLTRLASYTLSLDPRTRAARRDELTGALRAAARRAAGRHAGTWGRVAAVLDDSFSSYGSGVKRRRPLAVALACHHLLEALAGDPPAGDPPAGDPLEGDRTAYSAHWLSGRRDALMCRPYGPTPLGERIIDALEGKPDRLVIVSDGWDNAPPGLAGEVLRVWRTRLDPDRTVGIVHLNPVYDADGFDVRRLAPTVPTAGIRDAEDLPALVGIAHFAEGRSGLRELEAHLRDRTARFLREAP